MTVSMENYYFSCDNGQDQTEGLSVWRIIISVVTLDKFKLNDCQCGELLFQLWHWTRSNWMTVSVENYYFSCDTGQDQTEWLSVWRITISVVTLDKIKLKDCQYGELLVQFWSTLSRTRWTQMTVNMENYCFILTLGNTGQEMLNDNQYGKLCFQFWHWRRLNLHVRAICMENYCFSPGTGRDEKEWQSLWRITSSVLTLDKVKMNDMMMGFLHSVGSRWLDIGQVRFCMCAWTETGLKSVNYTIIQNTMRLTSRHFDQTVFSVNAIKWEKNTIFLKGAVGNPEQASAILHLEKLSDSITVERKTLKILLE